MKKLLIFLIILGTAQMYAQSVLTSSGGSNNDFYWSIGQVITESIVTDNYIVSQGFAQSGALSLSSIEVSTTDVDVSIYPNPVTDRLFIETENEDNYEWKITDMLGRIVKKGEKITNKEGIDMLNCITGQYILTVKSDRNMKSIIIIKN